MPAILDLVDGARGRRRRRGGECASSLPVTRAANPGAGTEAGRLPLVFPGHGLAGAHDRLQEYDGSSIAPTALNTSGTSGVQVHRRKWRRVRILGGDRTTAVFRRLEAARLRATWSRRPSCVNQRRVGVVDFSVVCGATRTLSQSPLKTAACRLPRELISALPAGLLRTLSQPPAENGKNYEAAARHGSREPPRGVRHRVAQRGGAWCSAQAPEGRR